MARPRIGWAFLTVTIVLVLAIAVTRGLIAGLTVVDPGRRLARASGIRGRVPFFTGVVLPRLGQAVVRLLHAFAYLCAQKCA